MYMSPENQWLEDVFPIEIVPFFRGHVSLLEGNLPETNISPLKIGHPKRKIIASQLF